ncbi:uncharacterized protein LOC128554383 [Mercenaria mercenaria]|uniref:uncharacterized protein LOC128554383 n=1 Tax=Mercenaria mercenaria TaxID=6596 RepID=UPI00234EF434|nr:uncharacterized protein LOC128554383 [Mercenaria mercenaria]
MSRTNHLKGSTISIDYDFPIEIQEARSRLWPSYKQYRSLNKYSKVKIVYPAKLLVDGVVVRDEMPDWDQCIRNSRFPNISYISNNAGRHSHSQYANAVPENPIPQVQPNPASHIVLPINGQFMSQTNSYSGETLKNDTRMTNTNQAAPNCSQQSQPYPPLQTLPNVPQYVPHMQAQRMPVNYVPVAQDVSASPSMCNLLLPDERDTRLTHVHSMPQQTRVCSTTRTEELQAHVRANITPSISPQQVHAHFPVVSQQGQPHQQPPAPVVSQQQQAPAPVVSQQQQAPAPVV